MNKKNVVALVLILLVLATVWWWFNFKKETKDQNLVLPTTTVAADFYCLNQQTIKAIFTIGTDNKVALSLSDGRDLSLPQVISASGARYANADESFVFWNKGDQAFIEENGQSTYLDCGPKPEIEEPILVATSTTTATATTTTLANPASTNCVNAGGSLEIQTKEDGSQYGLCYFDDARACEEWSMLRGDCPVGGVKTTGYDTTAQKYCAWLGGRTTTVADAVCTFKDNSSCLAADLYLGACQKGDWPNN